MSELSANGDIPSRVGCDATIIYNQPTNCDAEQGSRYNDLIENIGKQELPCVRVCMPICLRMYACVCVVRERAITSYYVVGT